MTSAIRPGATALGDLPPAWQDWIKENLARGCIPASMESVMVRDGRFEARLARAAIEEARSGGRVALAPMQPMPDVDTRRNRIECGDRQTTVLLAMQAPRVVLIGDLLSGSECEQLIAYAQSRLERSPVVADADGANAIHAYRTSRGAMLQRGESALVARIETRIAALLNWPVECGEGLQLLRYEKGNEYRPHYDWFDPALPGPARHLERGGQRVGTLIMYLSEVEQGGATTFPKAGLQIQPQRGHAVFFQNTDRYRVPDPQSLHAGEPVQAGIKFIATKWLREREY